jgi:hypothetical protein
MMRNDDDDDATPVQQQRMQYDNAQKHGAFVEEAKKLMQ